MSRMFSCMFVLFDRVCVCLRTLREWLRMLLKSSKPYFAGRASKAFVSLLAIVVFFLACSGCVSTSYIVDGNRYVSVEEAYARLNEMTGSIRQVITPLPQPILRRALVALPSDKEISSVRFSIAGSALANPEIRDFVIHTIHEWFALMAEAIQKRGVFKELTTKYYDDPESAPTDDVDYLIICDVDGWSLKDSSSHARKKIWNIGFNITSFVSIIRLESKTYLLLDPSKKAVPRTLSFLEALEAAALEFKSANHD